MPAWIIAAMRLLAAGAATGVGFEVAQDMFGEEAEGHMLSTGIPGLRRGGGKMTTYGPHPHKRRRRRRALTASDRADIGFIAGVLGKPAGREFAVILAARPR